MVAGGTQNSIGNSDCIVQWERQQSKEYAFAWLFDLIEDFVDVHVQAVELPDCSNAKSLQSMMPYIEIAK